MDSEYQEAFGALNEWLDAHCPNVSNRGLEQLRDALERLCEVMVRKALEERVVK